MRISNLSNKSGNPSSSDYLALDDGTTVTKIDYNKLAKAIIENYAGSTVAGSAQSVKAALDSLNSNKVGTFTLNSDYASASNAIFVRQFGKVVSINGYIDRLPTRNASTEYDVGVISGVSMPPQTVRTRGNVGTNAYSVGADAYINMNASGRIFVYGASAWQTAYFSVTYIAD